MKRLLDRESVRWGIPALAALLVFVVYGSIASIVLVASGGPEVMAAAGADPSWTTDDEPRDDDPDPGTGSSDTPGAVETTAPSGPTGPAARCEDLFSSNVVADANGAGLVLNPSWSIGTPPGALNLQDPELADYLPTLPSIDCRWVSPNGDSGVGIRSVVALVTQDEADWINWRLSALGYSPQAELGSTRYFFEASAGGTGYGESHIVVDGVWFATHWRGYGPRGYTADMVTNYFS